MTTSKISNRLIHEKSPYLLQHAYNPVEWWPWCEQAFTKAKAEDKPIFLSIGYSTCHWCHVMAHESFEDQEAADLLNENYVSIKVDREERPDIDSVYMSVCQALTGSGGWPLTIIMTPDQKPFYAATYLPKHSRWGNMGLIEVLNAIDGLWKNDRKKVLQAGDEITRYLNGEQKSSGGSKEDCGKELFLTAATQLKRSFDHTWGGFGKAPKFPMPHNLIFLLRHSIYEKDGSARDICESTLRHMYRGGIYDHIGGGFSRYSTDEKWLVPHFEKMLYDNALLSYAYLEAYKITRESFYQSAARGILGYIIKTLTDKDGGFYCGEDADSEGVEGKFYVFDQDEITQILKEDAPFYCQWFGITKEGNFEGKNILNLINNHDYEKIDEKINTLSNKLYEYRLKRTELHKDDKILTSWNGLMIAGMAKGYQILLEEAYLQMARNAQVFIEKNLTNREGRLLIRYRAGEAGHDGQLDDYAFYAFGLLELYQACFEASYLQKAVSICEKMIGLFFDEENGGFYMYAHDREKLISRPKELYDGALPSGNSVAAYVIGKLYHLTGEITWQEILKKQLNWMGREAQTSPANHSFTLLAFQTVLYPHGQLVAVSSQPGIVKELASLKREVLSDIDIIVKNPENEVLLSEIAPFTKDYPVDTVKNQFYLCKNGTCLKPVECISQLKEAIESISS